MTKVYLTRASAFAVVFAIALCGTYALAQPAELVNEDMLWRLTPLRYKTNAVVQVELDGAVGTGVIICVDKKSPEGDGYAGFCLTAEHVVSDDDGRRAVRVRYSNGKIAKRCKVVKTDKENDVALLWVWVPADIQPAKVAKQSVGRDEWVYFTGLGGGVSLGNLRHFRGRTAPPTTRAKIFSPVSLLPGDSGGPVFNKDGEVLGVISGGWLWFAAKRPKETNGMQATWPARACNLGAVRDLVADAVKCVNGEVHAHPNPELVAIDD